MSEDSRSRHDDGKLLYCSFCGKSQHEVRKLIAGPSVFVCDECVELCNDIIREEIEDSQELQSDLRNKCLLRARKASEARSEFVKQAREANWKIVRRHAHVSGLERPQ